MDGKKATLPRHADDYENLVPEYEEISGWKETTVGIKKLSDLPANAKKYIKRIEDLLGIPIDIISTGPDRSETIILNHPFK